MKNILVSGASGIIGYGILRALKKSGHQLNLIGTTIYEDSAAQGFCDVFEKAPLTNDPVYFDWLSSIIKKHNVSLIIPSIESDVYAWSQNIDALSLTKTAVAINNPELVLLCKDKWMFYQSLLKLNSPYAIPTTLETDFDKIVSAFGLPFLLKPRIGHASRGIVKVHTKEIFLNHQKNIGTILMVQPLIGNDDEEYTLAAFGDGKGAYTASIALRRKLANEGFTEKAEVVDLPEAHDLLESLCTYFKPLGPTNFQIREHKGNLLLLEINPRISSSTSIRTAFGYNEAAMTVDYFLENKLPVQPNILKGRAVRYTDDLIFYS